MDHSNKLQTCMIMPEVGGPLRRQPCPRQSEANRRGRSARRRDANVARRTMAWLKTWHEQHQTAILRMTWHCSPLEKCNESQHVAGHHSTWCMSCYVVHCYIHRHIRACTESFIHLLVCSFCSFLHRLITRIRIIIV